MASFLCTTSTAAECVLSVANLNAPSTSTGNRTASPRNDVLAPHNSPITPHAQARRGGHDPHDPPHGSALAETAAPAGGSTADSLCGADEPPPAAAQDTRASSEASSPLDASPRALQSPDSSQSSSVHVQTPLAEESFDSQHSIDRALEGGPKHVPADVHRQEHPDWVATEKVQQMQEASRSFHHKQVSTVEHNLKDIPEEEELRSEVNLLRGNGTYHTLRLLANIGECAKDFLENHLQHRGNAAQSSRENVRIPESTNIEESSPVKRHENEVEVDTRKGINCSDSVSFNDNTPKLSFTSINQNLLSNSSRNVLMYPVKERSYCAPFSKASDAKNVVSAESKQIQQHATEESEFQVGVPDDDPLVHKSSEDVFSQCKRHGETTSRTCGYKTNRNEQHTGEKCVRRFSAPEIPDWSTVFAVKHSIGNESAEERNESREENELKPISQMNTYNSIDPHSNRNAQAINLQGQSSSIDNTHQETLFLDKNGHHHEQTTEEQRNEIASIGPDTCRRNGGLARETCGNAFQPTTSAGREPTTCYSREQQNRGNETALESGSAESGGWHFLFHSDTTVNQCVAAGETVNEGSPTRPQRSLAEVRSDVPLSPLFASLAQLAASSLACEDEAKADCACLRRLPDEGPNAFASRSVVTMLRGDDRSTSAPDRCSSGEQEQGGAGAEAEAEAEAKEASAKRRRPLLSRMRDAFRVRRRSHSRSRSPSRSRAEGQDTPPPGARSGKSATWR